MECSRYTNNIVKFFLAALIFFAICLVDTQGVTSDTKVVLSNGNINEVLCNWSVAPLEINFSIDPGQKSSSTFNVFVNTSSNGGDSCNEGAAFELFEDGAISSWMNLTNNSFNLGYNQMKMIGINITVPNNTIFGINSGHIDVSTTTVTTQIDVNVNVTDNVGNISLTVLSSAGGVIAGATVYLRNGTTQALITTGSTNSSGMWQSNWLPIGSYNISASAPSYSSNSTTATVTKLATTSVTLTLTKSGGGGGGGGGGGALPPPAAIISNIFPTKGCIVVDRDIIKTKLKQGDKKRELLTITNICNKKVDVEIDLTSLMEFIAFQENFVTVDPFVKITLEPGQEQLLQPMFSIDPEQTPDVYTREMKIRSEGKTLAVPVIIEVISKEILLDITVDIPPAYQEISPGNPIVANFKIYNLGVIGIGQINVELYIKDLQDNILIKKERTVQIETQASFMETFDIPKTTPYGRYVVYGKAIYDSRSAVASTIFYVIEPKIFGLTRIEFWIVLIAILALLFVIFLLFRQKLKIADVISDIHRQYTLRRIKESI